LPAFLSRIAEEVSKLDGWARRQQKAAFLRKPIA
jgi:hypothetical protein